MEYSVMWNEGNLGVVLRPDFEIMMPPVVSKITNVDSPAAKANVQIGDLLISINGIDTSLEGYDQTVEKIKLLQLPAIITFYSPNHYGNKEKDRKISKSNSKEERYHEDPIIQSFTSIKKQREEDGIVFFPKKLKSSDCYKVIWKEGSLGVSFGRDKIYKIPIVGRINFKGCKELIKRIHVGDGLIAVNNQRVSILGFRNTINLLKFLEKPIELEFVSNFYEKKKKNFSTTYPQVNKHQEKIMKKISKDDNEIFRGKELDMYDIIWREGSLGLKLTPDDNQNPRIVRLTGKGSVSGLHNAAVGDYLVAINGERIKPFTYHHTLKILENIIKPCHLRFCTKKFIDLYNNNSSRKNHSKVDLISTLNDETNSERRKRLLQTAHAGRSLVMIKQHDAMMKELQGVIEDLKVDNYDDDNLLDCNSIKQHGNETRSIEGGKNCADCRQYDVDSLKLDNDGQYYCKYCWDNFYSSSNYDKDNHSINPTENHQEQGTKMKEIITDISVSSDNYSIDFNDLKQNNRISCDRDEENPTSIWI